MNTHHTKLKGDIALSYAIFILTQKGAFISLPVSENSPYDLICEYNNKLFRIQVKMRKNGDVPKKTSWADKNGVHNNEIDPEKIDLFFITNEDCTKYFIVKPDMMGKSFKWNKNSNNGIDYRYYEDYQNIEYTNEKITKINGLIKSLNQKGISTLEGQIKFIQNKLKENNNDKISTSIATGISYDVLIKFIRKNLIKIEEPQISKIKNSLARKTKISWPNNEELKNMVSEKGFSKTSRELGVSDNAVRKRIMSRGIKI